MKDDEKKEAGAPLPGASVPDEPEPSPDELAAAERLRDALGGAGGSGEPRDEPSDEIRLARALGHAFAPRDLDPAAHAEILARALARPVLRAPSRRAWVRATASASGALALAAAVLLFLKGSSLSAPRGATDSAPSTASTASSALVPRSTEPLFLADGRPLARRGSARIDRIAAARSGEYLQARLVAWGAQ